MVAVGVKHQALRDLGQVGDDFKMEGRGHRINSFLKYSAAELIDSERVYLEKDNW